VPVQGVRGVVTGVQVPFAAAVEHDSHCPVQATSQQTPSLQWLVAHSVSALQVVPALLPTHTPLLEHTGVFQLHPPQQVDTGTQLPLQSFMVPVHPAAPPPAPPVDVAPPVALPPVAVALPAPPVLVPAVPPV